MVRCEERNDTRGCMLVSHGCNMGDNMGGVWYKVMSCDVNVTEYTIQHKKTCDTGMKIAKNMVRKIES